MTEVRADYLTRIKPIQEKALSRKTIGVNLPIEMDEYVRSLPNRAEWLRQAIFEKMERERQESQN